MVVTQSACPTRDEPAAREALFTRWQNAQTARMDRVAIIACVLVIAGCGARSELYRPEPARAADASVDAVTACSWQLGTAQIIRPGAGPLLSVAAGVERIVLGLGDPTITLGGNVTAISIDGIQLDPTRALRTTRMPWRSGDVSVARSASEFAVTTSSGACNFFTLGTSGVSLRAPVEFSTAFCEDLQPAPTGWTVLAGAPDPTSETVARLDPIGRPIGAGTELLSNGEARLPARRTVLTDGSFLFLAQRSVFGAPVVVRHVGPDASTVLARNEIPGFIAARLAASGDDVWLVGLRGDARVPTGLHAVAIHLDRDGAPLSMVTDLDGVAMADYGVAAAHSHDSLWVMTASPTSTGLALRVQRVALDGTPAGAPFLFGHTTSPPSHELFIVATPTGVLTLRGRPEGAGYEIDAVPIACR